MSLTNLTWVALVIVATLLYFHTRNRLALRTGLLRTTHQRFRHLHKQIGHHKSHLGEFQSMFNLASRQITPLRRQRSTLQHSREYCKDYTEQKIAHILTRLENGIAPTSFQLEEWNNLRLAMHNESVYLRQICEKYQLGSNTHSAPARLELLATAKLMEHESLTRLQAPILKLYLKLSDSQRGFFDSVFNGHYHANW